VHPWLYLSLEFIQVDAIAFRHGIDKHGRSHQG
jgi:hypothetical protein